MPGSSSQEKAGVPTEGHLRGNRLHRRANNLYVAMDDDEVDTVVGDDDDDQNGDVQDIGREENDLMDDDSGTYRVVIERDSYSMSEFHQKHGYHSMGDLDPKTFVLKKFNGCRCGLDKMKGFFLYLFPAFDWLRRYNLKSNAIGDLMAGVTVGIVNIPQSMAFALLATLQPVYGLYTAFFAPLAFFFMGSSRHSSVGAFGVVSILCGDAVERIISDRYPPMVTGQPSSTVESIPSSSPPWASPNATMPEPCGPICDERVQLNTTLCLMVGLIQMLMAICRLGFVTTYLAHPLTRAFTTGAACHVITSQVPPLFGLVITRYAGPLSLIYSWRDIFINIPKTNVATFLLGLLSFCILAPGKYLSERYKHKIKVPIPWELFVVIITILISYLVNVGERYDVDIIGDIPVGFPQPTVPSLPSGVSIGDMMGDAIAIAVVGFAVSISLAKIFAAKNDYEIDANQELLAYGASNATSSFFLSFVSASALARVALLDGAGAKTQVSMLVSSIIIMFVLLVIGPLFEPLPKSVLAAIIIYALRGIVAQIMDLRVLFKTSKVDCTIWLVTFLSVFILGVDLGLLVGVVYALFTVVVRTQLPNYSEQGNVVDTELYCDVKTYNSVKPKEGILIFKMESSLYYANSQQFRQRILRTTGINPVKRLEYIRKIQAKEDKNSTDKQSSNQEMTEIGQFGRGLHTIIVDCCHFNFIDVTGVNTLVALIKDYDRIGIATVFCSSPDSVMRSIMVIGGINDDGIFYPSIHDAVISLSNKKSYRKEVLADSESDGNSTGGKDHERFGNQATRL